MNNCKCCVPCVCTGSGREQACKRHNIGYNILTIEPDVWISYNTHLPGMVFIVADVKIGLNC